MSNEKYVIRSRSGYQFTSCEPGKENQEETYDTYEQAEKVLEQIKITIPHEVFNIEKVGSNK